MINIKPLLAEKDLDAILIFNPKLYLRDPVFSYFTGLLDYEKSVFVGGNTQKVYVPSFEVPRAKQEGFLENVKPLPKTGLGEVLKKFKGKTVGVNGINIPLNLYRFLKKYDIKRLDVSAQFNKMMITKNSQEIAKLKKAIKLTKELFAFAKNGKSEVDIAADMSAYLVKKQAKFAFDPIISYGKNAALPHAKPKNTKTGCCILCDIGAAWKGYHADITRTRQLKQNKKFKEVYEIVKEAQGLAIDAVAPGKTAKEIDLICRGHLKKNGYKLIHSTGHGIGLTIHERPYISRKQTTILEPGMVFTVEPGVYIKGKFGIRIEDDILVTKTGRTVLSK